MWWEFKCLCCIYETILITFIEHLFFDASIRISLRTAWLFYQVPTMSHHVPDNYSQKMYRITTHQRLHFNLNILPSFLLCFKRMSLSKLDNSLIPRCYIICLGQRFGALYIFSLRPRNSRILLFFLNYVANQTKTLKLKRREQYF